MRNGVCAENDASTPQSMCAQVRSLQFFLAAAIGDKKKP
jgi:hypothetical protein